MRGDDIDTDRIIPARFLKSVSFEGLEHHLFEDDRREADGQGTTHPLSNPAYAGASIMLVNANFGCGSSREHAPQAIRRRGIRAVLGQSFSEIFFGNSVALGMPCPTASRETLHALMQMAEADPSATLSIDLQTMRVAGLGNGAENMRRSIAARNAASVFPDPVGARTRALSPAAIAGHASSCARVGAANVASNHARVAGLKVASGSLPTTRC